MTRYELTGSGGSYDVDVSRSGEGYSVTLGGETLLLKLKRGADQNTYVIDIADKPVTITLLEASSQRVELILNGEHMLFQRPEVAIGTGISPKEASASKDVVSSPMPGKVVGALVKKGETVKAGDPLIILESMKMEIAVRSDRDAEIAEILVEDGASVKRGQGLVRFSG